MTTNFLRPALAAGLALNLAAGLTIWPLARDSRRLFPPSARWLPLGHSV